MPRNNRRANHERTDPISTKTTKTIVARCTELINEQYAKLDNIKDRNKRWNLAFANAKAAHPEVFGAKTDSKEYPSITNRNLSSTNKDHS